MDKKKHVQPDFDVVGECSAAEEAHNADYDIDLSKAIYLSGPHHIFHNMQEGFASVLCLWTWYIRHLKHLCRLLTNRWTKARLLRTCFSTPPNVVYSSGIRQFHKRVYDKRWGTAMAAIDDLLPLHLGLTSGWSQARFVAGREMEAEGDEHEHSCDVDIAHVAISSKKFWGYSLMLDAFAWLIMGLSLWVDSCPCHGSEMDANDAAGRGRRSYYRSREKVRSCIMSCRRAPEMAAGTFMHLLQKMLNALGNTMAFELAELGLVAPDIAAVMRDFTSAKRHVWLVHQIKLSFWQILPWLFFGIGHPRRDIAKAVCRACLALRDASAAVAGEHWLIVALLVDEVGRKEMEYFAYNIGSTLAECTVLQGLCALFRFALTSERWVEALHAVSARLSANSHNFGPVHLAFHTVLEPLREALASRPQFLDQLAEAAFRVRNPFECLRQAGLMGHPSTRELLGKGCGDKQHMNQKHRADMIQILFHTDAATLHAEQPAPLAAGPAPGGGAGPGGGGGPRPPGDGDDGDEGDDGSGGGGRSHPPGADERDKPSGPQPPPSGPCAAVPGDVVSEPAAKKLCTSFAKDGVGVSGPAPSSSSSSSASAWLGAPSAASGGA